jgi:hypothetical protein
MFAIPGLFALIVFVYLRPQEYFALLQSVPLLYLFFALSLFGVVLDWRLRRARPTVAPNLLPAVLFMVWCVATVGARSAGSLQKEAIDLGISFALYLLIAHGLPTLRSYAAMQVVLLVLALALSAFGIHQGLQPFGCHRVGADALGDATVGVYDGRPCETIHDCEIGDSEPGADYLCERVGVLGTHSIGKGRVRYRGSLQDPNDLALAVGVGLPVVFALWAQRRTMRRALLAVIAVGAVGWCIVDTQSRGGQLIFLAAVGVYFVRRFGYGGVALGGLFAAPLMMLGGREGIEAEASSMERLECWYEGMTMWRETPIIGVGAGQFTDHHFLTAHNSYVLAAAELGTPGLFLFLLVLWSSLKIPIVILRRSNDKQLIAWAAALLASLAGLSVGIFFLSFCYHPVLWVWLGAAGALAVVAEREKIDAHLRFWDLATVAALTPVMIVILFLYTRYKV